MTPRKGMQLVVTLADWLVTLVTLDTSTAARACATAFRGEAISGDAGRETALAANLYLTAT